jgi:hypothetical protein
MTGLNPAGTKRTALQRVPFAIGAVVVTSGSKKIRVFRRVLRPQVIANPAFYGRIGRAERRGHPCVVTYHTYTAGSGDSGTT